jgi:hypothetical protein
MYRVDWLYFEFDGAARKHVTWSGKNGIPCAGAICFAETQRIVRASISEVAPAVIALLLLKAMYIICNKEPALRPCELALRGLAGGRVTLRHSDAGWSMQERAEVTLCTSVSICMQGKQQFH